MNRTERRRLQKEEADKKASSNKSINITKEYLDNMLNQQVETATRKAFIYMLSVPLMMLSDYRGHGKKRLREDLALMMHIFDCITKSNVKYEELEEYLSEKGLDIQRDLKGDISAFTKYTDVEQLKYMRMIFENQSDKKWTDIEIEEFYDEIVRFREEKQ